jgi:pilus assembly protein CpaC
MLALLLGPAFQSFAADEDSAPVVREEDARTVAVGTIDPLEFDYNIGDAVVGNAAIVKAEKVTPRSIRIVPLKNGTTSVDIYNDQNRRVRRLIYNVIKNDLSQKVLAIRKLLYDIEGISIESVDEKIVIDGELVVPRDLDRIVQVQSAYPEVLNLVTLSRVSREALARRMQKEINDEPGGVNITVKIINDTFFLFGKVDSAPDRDRADTIATTYVPEVLKSAAGDLLSQGAKKFSIRNMIIVEEAPPPPPPKMVRVTYHFVEIGKNFLKSSFFKWAPLMSDSSGLQIGPSTTGGSAASGTFAGTITSLLPKLQSGQNGGFSRVLFSTVTLGLENEQMEVLRQDSLPYIAAVVNGVPIPENANATINVKTTPSIQGEDKIKLNTFFQFTAFSGAGAGGKPRTTTTNMTNATIVKTGESAVLGGLISNQNSKDIGSDPESSGSRGGAGGGGGGGGAGGSGGGTPTAIVTLLRSKAFRNQKTQFVVFLTPKIIEDAAAGTADIKAKILNNSQKKRRRVVN